MCGQPGHNTQPQAQLSPSFLGMDAWKTSQLNIALIHRLGGSLLRLAFLAFYPWVFVQPGTGRRLVQEFIACTV